MESIGNQQHIDEETVRINKAREEFIKDCEIWQQKFMMDHIVPLTEAVMKLPLYLNVEMSDNQTKISLEYAAKLYRMAGRLQDILKAMLENYLALLGPGDQHPQLINRLGQSNRLIVDRMSQTIRARQELIKDYDIRQRKFIIDHFVPLTEAVLKLNLDWNVEMSDNRTKIILGHGARLERMADRLQDTLKAMLNNHLALLGTWDQHLQLINRLGQSNRLSQTIRDIRAREEFIEYCEIWQRKFMIDDIVPLTEAALKLYLDSNVEMSDNRTKIILEHGARLERMADRLQDTLKAMLNNHLALFALLGPGDQHLQLIIRLEQSNQMIVDGMSQTIRDIVENLMNAKKEVSHQGQASGNADLQGKAQKNAQKIIDAVKNPEKPDLAALTTAFAAQGTASGFYNLGINAKKGAIKAIASEFDDYVKEEEYAEAMQNLSDIIHVGVSAGFNVTNAPATPQHKACFVL